MTSLTQTTKVVINRLHTGVPGLDEVLGGGLPEFSFNLIAGPPGCGKTTLAHQMMFALATPERTALYFTVLGEPPLKMLRYQQQFDFFDSDAVNQSIRYVNLADATQAGDLDERCDVSWTKFRVMAHHLCSLTRSDPWCSRAKRKTTLITILRSSFSS